MGTNVVLDLLGSFIIGGMLLVNIISLQGNASSQSDLYSATRVTQKNLVTLVGILENDFRKLGYGVTDPTKSIVKADSNDIIFKADINRNGIIDTIRYYVGSTSELKETPNPNDKLLYRIENKETPQSSNLGLTRFLLKYYNQDMVPESNINAIKIVEITISVESPFPINGQYPNAFWKQTRITSRNLNR